jgi:hypothetical protein
MSLRIISKYSKVISLQKCIIRKSTRSYYKKGSNENRDAVELENLLAKAITAIQNGEDVTSVLGSRYVHK